MSNVPVASCAPRENNSAGFGARSTRCAVTLADEVPRQVLDQADADALRREGQIARRCGRQDVVGAGNGKEIAGEGRGEPCRLTRSIRPATCALVQSEN